MTAAPPYVASEALARWAVFFDGKHHDFAQMMLDERSEHGETQYHARRGFAMGMELACILTRSHVLALRGRSGGWA